MKYCTLICEVQYFITSSAKVTNVKVFRKYCREKYKFSFHPRFRNLGRYSGDLYTLPPYGNIYLCIKVKRLRRQRGNNSYPLLDGIGKLIRKTVII